MEIKRRKGLAVIVSGPSGAGKSTLLKEIRPEWPEMSFSVSWTTREPRPGEIQDVHYHFTTRDEFEKAVAEKAFLEYATVHGGYYGTPKNAIFEKIDRGEVVFLDIDVQGARQVRKSLEGTDYADSFIYVFVAPPSMDILEKRLRGRNTDSEEAIQRRLANARREMEACGEYQYVVINDDVRLAAGDLNAIMRAARCRTLK